MKKFDEIINRWIMPFSMKLVGVKGVSAVRDAFLQILPFTLASSLVVVLNVAVFSSSGFIGQYLVGMFPNIDNAQAFLGSVLNGTTTIMSLFIVFLIARNMANLYQSEDSTKAGITALTVFFIFYPIQNLESGQYFSTNYFGSNGLFVAIIIGLLIGWGFTKLSSYEKLLIKMPETVPSEVAKSFNVVIPIMIILVVSSISSFLVFKINPEGINALVYQAIQTPLTSLGDNVFSIFILELLALVLWVFGIHGTAAMSPIYRVMFAEANIKNLEYVATNGTAVGAPHPYTWQSIFENFGSIGGTGNTLGLVVAILICAKIMKNWQRDDYTAIAKLSLVPAIFCINEPLVFGLPIVMNPVLAIPFILSPIINSIIGVIQIALGLVPAGVLDSGWATPQPIKHFLATSGSWPAVVSQVLAFSISVLIYLPFVMAANKMVQSRKEGKNEL